MKTIVLGYSNSSNDLIDFCKIDDYFFLDDRCKARSKTVSGKITREAIFSIIQHDVGKYFLGIGSDKTFHLRPGLINRLSTFGFGQRLYPIPSVILGTKPNNFTIGKGCFIYPNTFIGSEAYLGDHLIALNGVSIGHGTVVDSFTIIASNAVISGDCHIGQNCYIGAGALIKDGRKVVAGTLIGMGAIVTKDIMEPGTYIGCPARKIA